jgi:dihydrofolate reductase
VLVGGVTYREMYEYWPGAADEEGSTETNKRMAHRMNTYRKLVFSRSGEPGPLEWANSERVVARDDAELAAFVTDLKAQPGGDIHVSGGAGLAQSLVRLGLVDEYRVYVYPVISPGAAWFGEVEDQRGLELVSATTYENGVIGLYYRAGGVADPGQRESFTEMLT